MADTEVTPEGLVVRRWLRRRLLRWRDLDRIDFVERRHVERRHPRLEMVRRGGGYWLRPRSDPGEVWYGAVVAVLKSGRRVKLRESYSQFRGDDPSLKEWADALRGKLAGSR